LQSIKQKGPCYECGPAAKTPLTKEPCGGKCIEVSVCYRTSVLYADTMVLEV
jgi:hypothetical protein